MAHEAVMSPTDGTLSIDDADFRAISDLLYERFGISLGEQKKTLVAGRLAKRLRELELPSFSAYVDRLLADPTGGELSEMIDRITTNHSFFFRERDHFDFLRSNVLRDARGSGAGGGPLRLRIWSAGCATGEEPYSIAMLLRERYGDSIRDIDAGILATDISLAALEEAKAGRYDAGKLAETPQQYRRAWFREEPDGRYALSEDIKSMVLFKRLNLMSGSYPFQGTFDAVFCRNVMIYFDRDSRASLVQTLYRYVKPSGYLFVGHSESLNRETCPFAYVKPAVYRKGGTDHGQ